MTRTETAPVTMTAQEAQAFSIGIYSSGRQSWFLASANPYTGEAFERSEHGRKMTACWEAGRASMEAEAEAFRVAKNAAREA